MLDLVRLFNSLTWLFYFNNNNQQQNGTDAICLKSMLFKYKKTRKKDKHTEYRQTQKESTLADVDELPKKIHRYVALFWWIKLRSLAKQGSQRKC